MEQVVEVCSVAGKPRVVEVCSSVEKPQQDDRLYRTFRLANGMRVMLVSDSTSEKSAAAMNVHVGFWSDPWEIPGVAHFLEHMLFMGTRKYPDENHYQAFLSSHGGSSNAYTSMEDTNYYFDVASEHFAEAVDIFAQFFVAPLMNENSTEREMNNVDSENSNNLQHDGWRYQQLRNSLAHPQHPFHKYGTGNKDTLAASATRDTRQALLDFHEKHYRAPNMSLCLFGRQTLDELQEWAIEKFSEVRAEPDTHQTVWVDEATGERKVPEAFGTAQLGKKVLMQTVKDLRSVKILYPLQPEGGEYLRKGVRYMSHLLGHEGPGSVFQALQKKGWCTDLMAGTLLSQSDVRLFGVEMSLTEEGLAHVDDVVATVQSYVALVHESGFPQWIYDECKQMAELEFRFKGKADAIRYVSAIASAMSATNGYADEHILSASHRFGPYDHLEIKVIAECLVPANMNVVVMAKSFACDLTEEEPWYGTAHLVTDFTEEQIAAWSNPPTVEALHLPSPNPFIPTDFSILGHKAGETAAVPTLISSAPSHDLWYKLDDKFLQPKANMYFKLFAPVAYEDAAAAVYTQLFIHMLEEELNEVTYNASVASTNCVFEPATNGMLIFTSGFSGSVQTLTKMVFDQLATFAIDASSASQQVSFAAHKDKLQRRFANFKTNQPYQLAQYGMQMATYATHWTLFDRLALFPDITLQGLADFRAKLLREAKVEALVHGNVSEGDAKALVHHLVDVLAFKPLPSVPIPQLVQCPAGQLTALDLEHDDPDAPNSAVIYVWQVGPDSPKAEAVVTVLANVVQEPCFDSLRTKQNLGYIVWSGMRQLYGSLLFRVIVQSPNKDPVYLQERVDEFLVEMKTMVTEMGDDEFQQHVTSLITAKRVPDRDLTQETSRHWQEINDRTHCFRRRMHEIQQLEKVTKEEVLSMLQEKILDHAAASRLVVRVYANGKMAEQSQAGEEAKRLTQDTAREFAASMPRFANPAVLQHPTAEASL